MRSLTQSSAGSIGTFFDMSPILNPEMYSIQATPLVVTQAPRSIPHITTSDPLPMKPSTTRHSFFEVDNSSQLLSSQAKNHVNQAIQNGWAKTTISRYSSAVEQFIRFCDSEGVPEHLRFPADEFVLCAFAASSLGIHSRSTPSSRLSALKAWHTAHNVEWKGSSRLRYVLNGVRNLAPGNSRRPPRPPINAKMLTQLVEHLNPASHFDAAVAACAATAFWGQCRLGELLPSSLTASLSNPLPTRSGFVRSLRNPQACLLHLPHTKTHHHGQDVVIVDQYPPVNPISLLKSHIRINNVRSAAHLFSYKSVDGPTSLTKSTFLRRCNEIWQALGYPRTTGHCFRIGGTTELLISGTPPEVVKATGRWSSESFLRYWRSLDDIAPQYIRYIHKLKPKQRRSKA